MLLLRVFVRNVYMHYSVFWAQTQNYCRVIGTSFQIYSPTLIRRYHILYIFPYRLLYTYSYRFYLHLIWTVKNISLDLSFCLCPRFHIFHIFPLIFYQYANLIFIYLFHQFYQSNYLHRSIIYLYLALKTTSDRIPFDYFPAAYSFRKECFKFLCQFSNGLAHILYISIVTVIINLTRYSCHIRSSWLNLSNDLFDH